MLAAAKHEARLAVDLYNRSSAERTLEGFVMHMHVAWLYMLQASFKREGIDYRYRKANGRFDKIDGEPKTWDLMRCLKEAVPDENNSVRRNVEFFIGLRNKIEHRYERLLSTAVAGKTQALVMNFEEALVERFGEEEGLGDDLRFPVFVSSLTPDAVDALKKTYKSLPMKLTKYIEDFESKLPEEVQGDWRFDFRVYLLPVAGPKTQADAVMRFVREEEMTDAEREARDVVQTIIRTKQVPVQNKGRHKPGVVAAKVQEALGVAFTVYFHTKAWQHHGVRPPKGDERPENTDDRYCVWDELHQDYLYTDAWVSKLIKDLGDRKTFSAVTGHRPRSTKKATKKRPT